MYLNKFIVNKNRGILVETNYDDNVILRFTRGYEIVADDISDTAPNSDSSINFSLASAECFKTNRI